ncbi:MAG: glycerate kinase [Candidatus Odinarchaeum yellowstonii]|uniref:Glycerate kinase n=1 Tax=Odinarchaeota yellowstonii (strain LCB_4) TaxID=1841599 RepID=A0AAF0D1E9_ODILC|nr:MAG: glycerate kinase [Candidatus Odinarchaeum yellowstonii]
MKIKNKDEIIDSALTEKHKKDRRVILDIVEDALTSVHPRNLLADKIFVEREYIKIAGVKIDKNKFNTVHVVGGGKGSGYLAEALEEKLGEYIDNGVVAVLSGTAKYFKTSKIKIIEASHPIPDERCIQAAESILRIVKEADEKDLIICLLTGGASALLTYPVREVSLKDIQQTHRVLLSSGANIVEMNAIKKHLSNLAGGRLAQHAYPRKLISLIISDVVGDRVDTISAGPTAPDQTTFKDCLHILEKYSIKDKLPTSVVDYINKGVEGLVAETPKEDDPVFENTTNLVIGSNRVALNTIILKAKKIGLNPLLLTSMIEGEAKELGVFLIAIAEEVARTNKPVKKPALIICGGESTVTLKGEPGLGGRNQTVSLSALTRIKYSDNITICCIGTDGVDGNSKAAGAIADADTFRKALDKSLDPLSYLLNFDSNSFFSKVGGEIITGPTGTNVNDIYMVMVS